jgi:hypothetical protein
MGATTFMTLASGATPQEAFKRAVAQAQYDHGHDGYSGTLAEKYNFAIVGEAADIHTAQIMADRMIDDEDPRIDDKWGPAGCLRILAVKAGKEPQFLFFGWASC